MVGGQRRQPVVVVGDDDDEADATLPMLGLIAQHPLCRRFQSSVRDVEHASHAAGPVAGSTNLSEEKTETRTVGWIG